MAERGDVMLREVLQAINLLREVRPLLDTADAPRAHSTDDCVDQQQHLSFCQILAPPPYLWNPVWILNRRGAKSETSVCLCTWLPREKMNTLAVLRRWLARARRQVSLGLRASDASVDVALLQNVLDEGDQGTRGRAGSEEKH